jgi:hypothetical protein
LLIKFFKPILVGVKMKLRAIAQEDYRMILEQDRRVYPTDSPVTERIIKSWYINNPEFGMIYEDEKGNVVGDCIIIPLNSSGWKKLISGKLSESEMTEEVIFNNSRDRKLGIHGYHIEKISRDTKGFHKIVLNDLANIVRRLKSKNSRLELIGVSGLCVTPSGIDLSQKKLGCKERDYPCKEHMVERDGRLVIIKSDKISNEIEEGDKLITKCKMLVSYPGEKSLIWEYL